MKPQKQPAIKKMGHTLKDKKHAQSTKPLLRFYGSPFLQINVFTLLHHYRTKPNETPKPLPRIAL